jgi:hypothetical protein
MMNKKIEKMEQKQHKSVNPKVFEWALLIFIIFT